MRKPPHELVEGGIPHRTHLSIELCVCGCCAPHPATGACPCAPRWRRCPRQTTRKDGPSIQPCMELLPVGTARQIKCRYDSVHKTSPLIESPRDMRPTHSTCLISHFAGTQGAAAGAWGGGPPHKKQPNDKMMCLWVLRPTPGHRGPPLCTPLAAVPPPDHPQMMPVVQPGTQLLHLGIARQIKLNGCNQYPRSNPAD